jgi:hypothetical protein
MLVNCGRICRSRRRKSAGKRDLSKLPEHVARDIERFARFDNVQLEKVADGVGEFYGHDQDGGYSGGDYAEEFYA